ncbi:MAG: SDR family oxidoreductase [Chryseolinea sp.]
MRILLTGATGYIGRRLLPVLVDAGHSVVCLVRNYHKFDWEGFTPQALKSIEVIEGDLNDAKSLSSIKLKVDVAFYLVHSMSSVSKDFRESEKESATNFVNLTNGTSARQIIYLSGIVNDENLSTHLQSRKNVEEGLRKSSIPVTVLRAAIIIGSGSASFEIIRDLVEKLPVMVAPRWLSTRCQPIAIRNVLEYLFGVMLKPETYNKSFDIGGTEILTYKEMLYQFAETRHLKRLIISVPFLTPRLSSLWLTLITTTSYPLARTLVNSMKNEVICKDESMRDIVKIKLFNYQEALKLAFDKISHRNIISSWKDSFYVRAYGKEMQDNMKVPCDGVFLDTREVEFVRPVDEVIDNLWSIGGSRGYYFGNWMWRVRGLADKLVGGVGLRRGRRSETSLKIGDSLDFWRVMVADKEKGRLILFAEMKIPGEAWLEFNIKQEKGKTMLVQTATFRPLGVWGRIYWYLVLPFHGILFPRMVQNIVKAL